MALAVKFQSYGGTEVLEVHDSDLPEPREGEVQIDHKAIGVNFIDSYYRTGLYPTTLPSGLGTEASGVVIKVGKGVVDLKVGDRVAYAQGPLGSYAEARNIKAQYIVPIPSTVSFEVAASVLLKGLTVYYLFKKCFEVKGHEFVLFHASAGGVGTIACQWARHLEVKLIGTASSDEKCQFAKENGAYAVINYKKENVVERVRELTEGKMVPVVYDGIGMATWETSLDCLRQRGLLVSYGNASGPVTGVNLGVLAQKGSLYVTRPILGHYISTYEDLTTASREIFDLVASGVIRSETQSVFQLSEVQKAHEYLADQKRVGGLILVP